MIRVMLADDHAIIREGLRVFLEMDPEIRVVCEVENGQEAVSQACALVPDVVIMDISMPELNGIEATRLIMQSCPQTGVIILSMLGTSEHVKQALQAGARGYLLKQSASKEVVEAVLAVKAGRRYFSEPITNMLVSEFLEQRGTAQGKSPVDTLSQREREILTYVVEGKSSAEIGGILFLSTKTVETYRARLMQKLGVKDMAGLIKFAIQNRLIELE